MAASFPAAIKTFTNPTASDTLDSASVPHHTQHADVNDEVAAVQTELGVNPSGTYSTVVARLDAMTTSSDDITYRTLMGVY